MDMGEIDNDRFERLEKMVIDMHNALMGDCYGNGGYKQWRMKVDKFMDSVNKIIWMVAGGAAVLSILINLIFEIV